MLYERSVDQVKRFFWPLCIAQQLCLDEQIGNPLFASDLAAIPGWCMQKRSRTRQITGFAHRKRKTRSRCTVVLTRTHLAIRFDRLGIALLLFDRLPQVQVNQVLIRIVDFQQLAQIPLSRRIVFQLNSLRAWSN